MDNICRAPQQNFHLDIIDGQQMGYVLNNFREQNSTGNAEFQFIRTLLLLKSVNTKKYSTS